MAETRPAGTVTVMERTKRGLTVVAVRDMIHVDWHPIPIAHMYRITTSTGFRASFRACFADRCLAEEVPPCDCGGQGSRSVNAWLAHARSACHDWHDAKVIKFAEKVLESTAPSRERPVGTGVRYQPKHFVPCAWPVERSRVVFTDGRARPDDYGYDINIPIVSTTEPTS